MCAGAVHKNDNKRFIYPIILHSHAFGHYKIRNKALYTEGL